MNILVFDTETININKPFCYNVGYVIYDTEAGTILVRREYVIEQIWHNVSLFATAYYTEKRPLYVRRMKGRTIELEKFGFICQQMIRDIKNFSVVCAYAYNGEFDENVFNFNCDWFKCINPFENIPIYDIRGNVHHEIAFSEDFQDWCEEHEAFTEAGNYSTTAETLYRYVSEDTDFKEEHTALADTLIELEILTFAIEYGKCKWGESYTACKTIPRKVLKNLTITLDGKEILSTDYQTRINRKDKIILKSN